MDDNNQNLNTADSSTAGDASTSGSTGAGQQTNDEWFLDVGDGRTRYKTREEAIKGYSESGKRIASLSAWERAAQQYGVQDPRLLPQLFDELIQFRNEKSKANQTKTTNTPANPEDRDRAEVEKFLEEWASKNGFVKKDALDPLQQKIQTFDDDRFNARVSEGQNVLKDMLEANKLPTDPKFSGFIENYLRAYIDADDARVAAFYEGGPAMREMLKDGFAAVTEALGLLKAGEVANSASSSAEYVNRKNSASSTAGKPLPQHGLSGDASSSAASGGQKPEGFSPDTHNRAWEIFQKASGQRK